MWYEEKTHGKGRAFDRTQLVHWPKGLLFDAGHILYTDGTFFNTGVMKVGIDIFLIPSLHRNVSIQFFEKIKLYVVHGKSSVHFIWPPWETSPQLQHE